MPTLFRLLTTLAVIAGIIYGIMAALVYFVEPNRQELTIDVELPPLKVVPAQPQAPPAAQEPAGEAAPEGATSQ